MFCGTAVVAKFDSEINGIVLSHKQVVNTIDMGLDSNIVEWFMQCGLLSCDRYNSCFGDLMLMWPMWWEFADGRVPSLKFMSLMASRPDLLYSRHDQKIPLKYTWLINKHWQFMGVAGVFTPYGKTTIIIPVQFWADVEKFREKAHVHFRCSDTEFGWRKVVWRFLSETRPITGKIW